MSWARMMTERLFDAGSPLVHFYVMQNTDALVRLMGDLGHTR